MYNSYWNRLRLKNLGKLAKLACHRIDQFTLESFFRTLRDIKFCRLPSRGCERNIRRDCNDWHFAREKTWLSRSVSFEFIEDSNCVFVILDKIYWFQLYLNSVPFKKILDHQLLSYKWLTCEYCIFFFLYF